MKFLICMASLPVAPTLSSQCPSAIRCARFEEATSGLQPMLKLRWIGEEAQRKGIAQEFKAVLEDKVGKSAALSLSTFDAK